MESSPDNAGTDQYYRMGRVRQARQEGVREEPVLKLLKSPASSNSVDMGWPAMRTAPDYGAGTWMSVKVVGIRGHGEGLRRSRGDIAGA